jgi:hypothetical protein
MNASWVIEILTIIALVLAITVCILLIILLIRALSAIRKVDDFFSYFDRIRGVLESFEGIPAAVVSVAKDFLFELIGKWRKNENFDEDTIPVKKRQK